MPCHYCLYFNTVIQDQLGRNDCVVDCFPVPYDNWEQDGAHRLDTLGRVDAAWGASTLGRYDFGAHRPDTVLRIPPPPHDYPYYWVILDPKSKEDKVKVTNLWLLKQTLHTFWSCLIRCANMQWIRWVLLKIQSGHDSVHRRTDKVKPVYPPFNFVEEGGIISSPCLD